MTDKLSRLVIKNDNYLFALGDLAKLMYKTSVDYYYVIKIRASTLNTLFQILNRVMCTRVSDQINKIIKFYENINQNSFYLLLPNRKI